MHYKYTSCTTVRQHPSKLSLRNNIAILSNVFSIFATNSNDVRSQTIASTPRNVPHTAQERNDHCLRVSHSLLTSEHSHVSLWTYNAPPWERYDNPSKPFQHLPNTVSSAGQRSPLRARIATHIICARAYLLIHKHIKVHTETNAKTLPRNALRLLHDRINQ